VQRALVMPSSAARGGWATLLRERGQAPKQNLICCLRPCSGLGLQPRRPLWSKARHSGRHFHAPSFLHFALQRRSAAEAATAALDSAKRQADEEAERAAREKTKRQRLEDDNRVGPRVSRVWGVSNCPAL
jgi:hypothetical protein